MNSEQNGTGPAKMPLICTRCGQHWSITPNAPEVFNTLRSSGCVLSHERLLKCPNNRCAQPFIITVQAVSLQLAVQPVDDSVVEQVEGTRITRPTLTLAE